MRGYALHMGDCSVFLREPAEGHARLDARSCRVQARSHKSRSQGALSSRTITLPPNAMARRAVCSANAGAQFERAAGLGLDFIQSNAGVYFGQGQAAAFGDFEHAQVGDDQIHHALAGDWQFALLEDLG